MDRLMKIRIALSAIRTMQGIATRSFLDGDSEEFLKALKLVRDNEDELLKVFETMRREHNTVICVLLDLIDFIEDERRDSYISDEYWGAADKEILLEVARNIAKLK